MQTQGATVSQLSGSRTVLVVDDEPAVRLSLKSIIDKTFNVADYADGPQAMQYASAHAGEIYAAFVDYGMSPMNGSHVCAALRSLDATISLIGFSGIEDAPFEVPLFATLLKKNISPEHVLTIVTNAVRTSEQLRSR